MPDFGIFRGFNDKLFGDKLYAGQLPTQLGIIGSEQVSDFIGLLDTFPNAAAAYSLRKLRTEYTGSAIRVRRTNLDEMDIGLTSTGALDTTALLAFTGTGMLDNGFITRWYDQSGNGRDAIQSTILNQPQIVSAGSLILQNTKPTVYFGWAGNVASVRLETSSFATISQPYSVFTSFATDTNDQQCVFDGINSNSQIGFLSNKWWMINNNTTYGTVTTAMQLHSNFFNSSGNFEAAYNGNLTSNLQRINSNLTGVTLGHLRNAFAQSYQFNGNISECIVYPLNQSSNRTGIETNINNFYSIY